MRLGASALALLASLPARAQSTAAERSYALDYEAPAKCPDAAAVRAAIESRTTGASAVEPPQAAVRFTLHGTHTGDYLGMGPTGRRVSCALMGQLRVVDGAVVEHWGVADGLHLLQQLGLLPESVLAATA